MIRRSLRVQASAWLARMWSDDVTPEDRAAFEAWLNADPDHAQAYEAVKRAAEAVASVGRTLRYEREPTPWERFWRNPTLRPLALTAVSAMAACGAFFVWASIPQSFETTRGEQRTIELWDGSRVELNTASRIEVRPLSFIASRTRRIHLRRGEAIFVVRHDERGFEVLANGAIVRATGTVFAVRAEDEGADVLVSEGSVLALLPISEAAISLHAADALRWRRRQITIETLSDEELLRRQAWRLGMLSFDGQTLAEVGEDIARYSDVEFVFADSQSAETPIIAYVRASDVETFLDQLEASDPGLNISRNGDTVTFERRGE